MKQKTKAFTLIELLVVVLIIGILAAIALPQYQKAVIKSRVAELVLFIRDARQAKDLYVLESGYPATCVNLEDVAVQLPWAALRAKGYSVGGDICRPTVDSSPLELSQRRMFSYSYDMHRDESACAYFSAEGKMYCEAFSPDTMQNCMPGSPEC